MSKSHRYDDDIILTGMSLDAAGERDTLEAYLREYEASGTWMQHELCCHVPTPVLVGGYTIWAAATWDLDNVSLEQFDAVIPLAGTLPEVPIGERIPIVSCRWDDGKAPPKGFTDFLTQDVVPMLRRGERVLVYCMGGHGRTGTFLASLIALLEADCQDPIAEVRQRHCHESVETFSQAQYIYSLLGRHVPKQYRQEFAPRPRVWIKTELLAPRKGGTQ